MFNFTNNFKELFLSYFIMSVEFIKIFFSCMLTIFVSQSCYGLDNKIKNILQNLNISLFNDDSIDYIYNIKHECTIQDNFSFQYYQPIDFVVISINFITFTLFMINFFCEIFREHYIIINFDYNKNKKAKDYKNIIINNNLLYNKYIKYTKILYKLTLSCICMFIINIIISSYSIFTYYYNGDKSITGLIASIILILQKLQKNYSVTSESLQKGYIQSTILFRPYFYNTIDKNKFNTNEILTDSINSKESTSNISIYVDSIKESYV